MKSNKKSMTTTFIMLVVSIIAVILIVNASTNFLVKGKNAVLNPIKKFFGIQNPEYTAQKKEQERIGKSLLENAEKVYNEFEAAISKCVQDTSSNKPCMCGTMDFTNLNQYSLKLTNDRDSQTLEFLDSSSVPVAGKRTNLGSFVIVPVDGTSSIKNSGTVDFYNSPDQITLITLSFNPQYLTFSKDNTAFYKGTYILKKSEGSMKRINFIKLKKGIVLGSKQNSETETNTIQINVLKDTIVADENEYGFGKCYT